MTEVNGMSFTVANVTSDTFELQDLDEVDVDTSSYTTYSISGEARKKVSSISGVDHLEGETVEVLGDGAIQTSKVVTSGAIILDSPASMVHVGLSYESRWRSLKLAFGAQGGTAIGKYKNLPESTIVLMEAGEGSLSLAVEENKVEGDFTPLDLRGADDIDEDPVPFFTGEKLLGLSTGFDFDIRLVLKGSAPVPFTVLAVAPEIQMNEAV
jgi:hypothetical protein